MDFKAILGDKYKDDMSMEDLVSALKETEIPSNEQHDEHQVDESAEIKRMKAALDKASKEAAENKRQLRAYQTEVDASNAEKQNKQSELEAVVKELQKKSATQEYINRLNRLNMKDADATDMANSLYGAADPNGVLTVLETYSKELEAELRKKILQETPKPAVGGVSEQNENLRIMNDMRRAMGLPMRNN